MPYMSYRALMVLLWTIFYELFIKQKQFLTHIVTDFPPPILPSSRPSTPASRPLSPPLPAPSSPTSRPLYPRTPAPLSTPPSSPEPSQYGTDCQQLLLRLPLWYHSRGSWGALPSKWGFPPGHEVNLNDECWAVPSGLVPRYQQGRWIGQTQIGEKWLGTTFYFFFLFT